MGNDHDVRMYIRSTMTKALQKWQYDGDIVAALVSCIENNPDVLVTTNMRWDQYTAPQRSPHDLGPT